MIQFVIIQLQYSLQFFLFVKMCQNMITICHKMDTKCNNMVEHGIKWLQIQCAAICYTMLQYVTMWLQYVTKY